SAAAMLPRISAPTRLLDASIEIATGMEISPIRLADLLADAGFSREDPVDEHGEFCVRGGVVDYFPAGDANWIPGTFVSSNIESTRRYAPATQRSVSVLDRASIVPVRDTFDDAAAMAGEAVTLFSGDRTATIFDYAAAGRRPVMFVSEPDDVEASV